MKRDDQGTLIILEGIDGSGKTTQVARIVQWLRKEGLPIVSLSEPTQGKYGKRLRQIMRDGREGITPEDELNLFLKDRKEDVERNILPALRQNCIVIMDRYYYSNMAYQAALGIDIHIIETLNKNIAPCPDIVFILDIDVHMGLHRINTLRQEKENHFEKAEYLKKVSENFHGMKGDNIYHISAARPLPEVNSQIDRYIRELLSKKYPGCFSAP